MRTPSSNKCRFDVGRGFLRSGTPRLTLRGLSPKTPPSSLENETRFWTSLGGTDTLVSTEVPRTPVLRPLLGVDPTVSSRQRVYIDSHFLPTLPRLSRPPCLPTWIASACHLRTHVFPYAWSSVPVLRGTTEVSFGVPTLRAKESSLRVRVGKGDP